MTITLYTDLEFISQWDEVQKY